MPVDVQVCLALTGMSSFYTELNRGLGASQRLWELLDRVPAIPVSATGISHLTTSTDSGACVFYT